MQRDGANYFIGPKLDLVKVTMVIGDNTVERCTWPEQTDMYDIDKAERLVYSIKVQIC